MVPARIQDAPVGQLPWHGIVDVMLGAITAITAKHLTALLPGSTAVARVDNAEDVLAVVLDGRVPANEANADVLALGVDDDGVAGLFGDTAGARLTMAAVTVLNVNRPTRKILRSIMVLVRWAF